MLVFKLLLATLSFFTQKRGHLTPMGWNMAWRSLCQISPPRCRSGPQKPKILCSFGIWTLCGGVSTCV